jgi:hypothetical protein
MKAPSIPISRLSDSSSIGGKNITNALQNYVKKYGRLILLKIFRNQTIVLKFGLLNKPLHGVVAKACQHLTFIAKTGLIKPRCIVIPRRGFGILMKSFETFDLQSISNLAFINLPLSYIL